MTMNNESEATFSTVPLSAVPAAMAPQQQQQLQDRQQHHHRYAPLFRSIRSRSRPVRRALVELGRNDSGYNAKFAASDRMIPITISVERFRDKYNFDPIKGRPITSTSAAASSTTNAGDGCGDTSGDISTNINDIVTTSIKYQWDLIGNRNISSSEHYRDQKQLEKTVCSLVSMNSGRYQTTLRRVPVLPSTTAETEATAETASEIIVGQAPPPAAATSERLATEATDDVDEVVSSSSQDDINETVSSSAVTTPAAAITADDNKVTSSSCIISESITPSSSNNNDELQRRLTINNSNNNDSSRQQPAAVTVGSNNTAATETNNNNITSCSSVLRQSKITDFAPHRKRVHSSSVGAADKLSSVVAAPDSPDTKRRRLF